MSHVNPPPQIRIPEKIFSDPELRPYFERVRTILWQLWNRTGGPIDLLETTDQSLIKVISNVSRNAANINALEKEGFDVEIITADYTTERNQIIICKNTSAINVTLDPNAIEEDRVHIKRANEVVYVIGNIDGKTFKKINVKYYSMFLVFDGTSWHEI